MYFAVYLNALTVKPIRHIYFAVSFNALTVNIRFLAVQDSSIVSE